MQTRVIAGATCRIPATVLNPEGATQTGTVVVFHGLASNRKLMLTIGQRFAAAGLRVYLLDLPGHGDNTQPFSFVRAEDCAAEAVDELARQGELRYERTILLGHSMGGAIAIRMADRFPTAATIAISPAPMAMVGWLPPNMVLFAAPRRMPVNMLIFTGGWEPELAAEWNAVLLRDAGGERTTAEDFLQKRAAQLVIVPGATHVGLVFDPRVVRRSVTWARTSLGLVNDAAHTSSLPAIGSALGLLGLFVFFPLAANTLCTGLTARASPAAAQAPINFGGTLILWGIASAVVVLLLQLWVPLRFLHIFTGDYYASFKLILGCVILLFSWRTAATEGGSSLRPLCVPAVLAIFLILSVGGWLNWQITDLWMNSVRWLRFIPLVAACFPFYLAEESALGPPGVARARRWALFIALRLVSWGAMVAAIFVFATPHILILLMGVFLALLALAQRFGADAVRRRTGSATAAALYSAILGGWFIAAVLPIT
jgi:pimeloyl-ACP methyl ester carboxylesterase